VNNLLTLFLFFPLSLVDEEEDGKASPALGWAKHKQTNPDQFRLALFTTSCTLITEPYHFGEAGAEMRCAFGSRSKRGVLFYFISRAL
jgi:predicted secreted protein